MRTRKKPEEASVDPAADVLEQAHDLCQRGEYLAAKPLFEKALAIHEKTRGLEHPDTARSLNNLAHVLGVVGDDAAAKPLMDMALAIREKELGPEHFLTGQSLNNLACWFLRQGDAATAKPLFERALTVQEKALGPEHPAIAATLNNLAELLIAHGERAAAEPLQRKALALFEKSLGADDELSNVGVHNIAVADPDSVTKWRDEHINSVYIGRYRRKQATVMTQSVATSQVKTSYSCVLRAESRYNSQPNDENDLNKTGTTGDNKSNEGRLNEPLTKLIERIKDRPDLAAACLTFLDTEVTRKESALPITSAQSRSPKSKIGIMSTWT